MNPLKFIAGIFDPIKDLISEAIPDPDKRREILAGLEQIRANSLSTVSDLVKVIATAQASVIRAEVKAGGLAAQWRPITALAFVSIVVYNEFLALIFGLPRTEIVPDLWEVIKIMIGGYVVSRGAEKVVDSWAQTRKPNESI